MAWTAVAKWTTQVLSWASTIIVARLLVPADYGILGLALLVLGFFSLTGNLGLGAAVIHHRDMIARTRERLAGVSVGFGLVLAVAAVGLARPMSIFFSEPALTRPIMVLSLQLVFSGLQVVPRSLLQRDFRFKVLAKIDAGEALAATACTLTLAIMQMGYWSLVFGNIFSKAVSTILVMHHQAQRIRWPGRLRELVGELTFGGHMLLANVGWYVYGSADIAIVGRLLSTGAVGAYSLALNIGTAPMSQVTALISRVVPGVFSAMQDDRTKLARYLTALLEGQAFVVFPISAGMALVAPDLVGVALGSKWLAAVVPLQVLSISTAAQSLSPVLIGALVFSGHPAANSRITMSSAVVLPMLFLIGARWGIAGVAFGWLAGNLFFMLPMTFSQSRRYLGFGYRAIIRSVVPALNCTLVMAAGVLAVQQLIGAALSGALRLGLAVLTGVVCYALAVRVLYWPKLTGFLGTVRDLRRA